MAVDIATIEAAMLARIAGAKLPYLRTVATYGGELDEGLTEAVRQFPAVWIAFKSMPVPRIVTAKAHVTSRMDFPNLMMPSILWSRQ